MVVGLICLVALVLAYQATRTALALHRVKKDVGVLSRQVESDDVAGARSTLRDIAHQASVAHGHSDNFLWSVAGAVPWIGNDVDAVRVASSALDTTARRALPEALAVYQSDNQQKLRSADGKFNTAAISRLTPRFVAMSAGVTPADRELDAIDADQLRLGVVRNATRDFQERLDSLATLAHAGTTATRLLPGMLGAKGPRTYLLVEQSNAEIRATGGLPGAFSLVEARDGRIKLGRQFSDADFPGLFPRPVVPLTSGELGMYTTQIGRDVRDFNATPDFPRAAQILDAMYAQRFGRAVDGVVFVDPFVLSALLKVTGPVTVGAETFHADDVVRKLLNTVYLRFPEPDRQDAYFASAAKGLFDVLSTRPVSQSGVLRALAPMVEQRRFLVWSRHQHEQAELARTTIAGALPRGERGAVRAGMYLNGSTSAKMEYYLDYVGGVRSVSCSTSGVQQFQARLRLKSNAPRDVSSLPTYVTGTGRFAPKGSMLDRLYIYGPAGGRIVALEANGKQRKLVHFRNGDRPVVFQNLVIAAQGQIEITATFETEAGGTAGPTFDWTPGMHAGPTSVSARSSCG